MTGAPLDVTTTQRNIVVALRQRTPLIERIDFVLAMLGLALEVDRVLVRLEAPDQEVRILAIWRAPWVEPGPSTDDADPSPVFAELLTRAIEHCSALVVDDVALDHRLTPGDASALMRHGVNSALFCPLAPQYSTVGMLALHHNRAARIWTSREVTVAECAAREIEAAIVRERAAQLESNLAQSERDLDASRSNFLSSVSHELRSPLTSIRGYVELLADAEYGPLSDEQSHAVEVVDRNCRRLRGLIEDILTTSSAEAGTLQLQFEPVALRPLLRAAVEAVNPTARARSLRLEISDPPKDACILGDPDQLERVLLNLLQNAMKFTPAGGSVALAATSDGSTARITVRDTGVGVSAAEQPFLFDRFYRGGSAYVEGAGLGLYIVKTVVDRHGGTVELVSSPGVGTTVTCVFPAVQLAAV